MLEKSITSYEELQFAPLGEGNPVEAALLWGDPATGPVAFLVRMPAGYAEPWHSHTSTYRAVLIDGEFRSRGKDAATDFTQTSRPGAYLVQPGGQTHAEVNAGDRPLLALVFFEGPADFVPSA
ncbi:MAG: cupin domain-containing protein [Micromonosporaceae bacterium]